ncbi:hypothetical protein M408DRAFT_210605 [Serendipita vermifera MAFF 305830]|uniref:Uncharacterized protein n=1 Tax=Serendipita vermifera MAFF 305830 TaxID=933852 RepID=A0A0C2X833_SERVB|nr:hypothetical protein M408DRAFT_210605 [Serendipita vermifera MAFF 305830]
MLEVLMTIGTSFPIIYKHIKAINEALMQKAPLNTTRAPYPSTISPTKETTLITMNHVNKFLLPTHVGWTEESPMIITPETERWAYVMMPRTNNRFDCATFYPIEISRGNPKLFFDKDHNLVEKYESDGDRDPIGRPALSLRNARNINFLTDTQARMQIDETDDDAVLRYTLFHPRLGQPTVVTESERVWICDKADCRQAFSNEDDLDNHACGPSRVSHRSIATTSASAPSTNPLFDEPTKYRELILTPAPAGWRPKGKRPTN